MASHGDRFRRRALSRGYKVDEVDAFLDRVEATLAGEPIGTAVASQEVDDVVFRVRFGGYDEWQVDVYLDRVARQLSELEERGMLGSAPSPEYAGPAARGGAGGAGPGGQPPAGRDRTPPPPSRRPEPPRAARAEARPPAAAPAPDPEGFGHLRGDDSEGFGHLRGGGDDDPFGPPAAPPPPPPPGGQRGADPYSPDRRFESGPPEPMNERRGGPPPEMAGQPGRPRMEDERFGPPPERRFPPGEDRFDQQRRPGQQQGPGPVVGTGMAPQAPPRAGQEFDRDRPGGYPPGGDERFAPPPPGRTAPGGPPPSRPDRPGFDPNSATMVQPAVPASAEPPAADGPPPGSTPPPANRPPAAEPRGYREPARASYEREPAPAEPPYSPPPPPPGPPGPPAAAGRGDFGHRNPYSSRGAFDEPGRHGREEMTTEMRSADSPFSPDDLQRLEQMRRAFQPRRFGSGYDPAQVDRIFDAVTATMSGRAPVPLSDKELDTSQFSLVQCGYFEAEVDAALREVREMFARRGMMH